jgi:recombination protein RecA
MSQALRKLAGIVSKTNTCVVFINQIRMKIGVMFGNPETTTGGNALKYYSSVRLDIRRIANLKDGDNIVGNRTKVKAVKNKVAPPFRVAEFDIIYGEGISYLGDVVDLGATTGILEKSGTWLSYGQERLGQGREKAKQFLRENPAMLAEIDAKIRQHYELPTSPAPTAEEVKDQQAKPEKASESATSATARNGKAKAAKDEKAAATAGV